MQTTHTHHRRALAAITIVAMLASLLGLGAAPPAYAMGTVIARDLSAEGPLNLVDFGTDAPDFSSAGDGFEIFQRGVSDSIPFAVLDDSAIGFPPDNVGIITEADTAPFFGVTDTVNGDNPGAVAYNATWQFAVAGASDLQVSIDMGAMGDFEAADQFRWSYAFDGGASTPLFELLVDEDDARDYTMAGGTTYNLVDPINVGPVELSNVLQTVTAPLAGTGATLALTLTAITDGGSEGVAFQNIVITQGGGGGGPAVGDLVITEVLQNPAAVSDSAGEWFELTNTSAQPISLDGWVIGDDDFDSHVITGPVEVGANASLVLGINADMVTNGNVAVAYQYTGVFLSNGADELVLTNPEGVVFDRIAWDGGPLWPDPNGASMQLDRGLTTVGDNDAGSSWCTSTDPFGDGDRGTPGATNLECVVAPSAVAIHEIQGSGPTVAITATVEVQAVVTALFERDDALDGFFVQEEDADADADTLTSEGIFVFCRGNCPAPGTITAGSLVTVVGTPTDFFGMSQIDMTAGSITVDGTATLPTPVPVLLPAGASTTAEATFESIEGMLATFPNTLAVSEYFELARYGQIVLTDTARPHQFTHSNPPSVAGYESFLADLATRRIILDDDSNDQNDVIFDGPDESYYYPEGGLSTGNRFRGGDTIAGLTGVMHWSFAGQSGTDAWRIRPVPTAFDYVFTAANPTPYTPTSPGGSLTVGSFNVLNYFTTIDMTSGNDGPCGPSATLDCRGADSLAELDRQRAKIVSAIAALDADVLGLVELENDGDDSSIADLVAGLNAALGAGTYAYVSTGFIGEDAIKVGFIYQPATAEPIGDPAVLDNSVDPSFLDSKNRPALIQTFREVATGEKFTVAVNHFKSKGSSCDDVGDPGRGDGQANCPGTRAAAATALASYLATDPTGSGDPDFLIVGDLNAYAMEDAVMALVAAGYTDLVAQYEGPAAYSFVFDGQLGYLDHALANPSLSAQVTGAATWHINADEVNVFDYNDAVQDPGERSFERESALGPYAPDAFRSSDHDPVVVGLALNSIPANPTCNGLPATIVGTNLDDTIVGTSGDDVIVTFGGNDTIDAGNGSDTICAGGDDDVVLAGNGIDWVDAAAGDDIVNAGNGDDVVFGGSGDDALEGDRGEDWLDAGGDAGDVIDGGPAIDTCVAAPLQIACEL